VLKKTNAGNAYTTGGIADICLPALGLAIIKPKISLKIVDAKFADGGHAWFRVKFFFSLSHFYCATDRQSRDC
jgi:hypothetical protein